METSQNQGDCKIRLTSPVLARSVYLSLGSLEANVSDDHFNLLPGEAIDIIATRPTSLDQLRALLKVRSLADAFSIDHRRRFSRCMQMRGVASIKARRVEVKGTCYLAILLLLRRSLA